ncbi:f-box domain-containing protein [Phthorimaea operculella]|nr:f-box domain-containing protein [Phthorimaea operculella]
MSARAEESYFWHDECPGLTELPSTTRRKQRSAPYRLHRPHLPATHVPEPVPEPQGTHISRLYPELLALIFERLPVMDRGRAAQVCRAWRDAAERRSVWRGVEASLHLRRPAPVLFQSLARRGVRKLQVLSLRRGLRDAVAALPGLESLSLRGCYSVTDAALASAFAAELPALKRLDLSLCKQVTDSSLGRIAQSLKNLEVLELGGCSQITDTGLLLIAWGLKKLKHLNLRSCWHVTDAGIAHLCGGGEARGTLELEYLGLQDCQRMST